MSTFTWDIGESYTRDGQYQRLFKMQQEREKYWQRMAQQVPSGREWLNIRRHADEEIPVLEISPEHRDIGA